MNSTGPVRERIEEFESLRGLMALWVVLGHVALSFSIPAFDHAAWWRLLGANREAVDIFIVLSGFVIFYMLDAKRERYPAYLTRRFMRIFPAYGACLVASVFMVQLSMDALNGIPNPSPRDADRIALLQSSLGYFWQHLMAHATMLHGLVPKRVLPLSEYAFIGQAWSISVEWQFYIIAPLCFYLATKKPRVIGLSILGLLCAGLFLGRKAYGEGFVGAQLPCFIVGCASFFFWRMDRVRLEFIARYNDALIVVACAGLVLISHRHGHIAIWIAVLLSCSAVRFERHGFIAPMISGVLRLPVLRWLGRVSYSVYLVHMLALYAILWMLRGSGLHPVSLLAIVMASTVTATLLISAGMHRWIEIPGIAVGHLMARRQKAVELTGTYASTTSLSS